MGEESVCGLPNEFCFMDLKKGSKIIGVLCLIFSIVAGTLLMIYLVTDVDDITKEIADNNQEMIAKLEPHNDSTRIVAALLLVLAVVYIFSSIMLIRGAQRKSKKHILPFLIITVIAIMTSLIISITQYHGAFYAMLTVSVILIYFFLCVFSFYKNLAVDY